MKLEISALTPNYCRLSLIPGKKKDKQDLKNLCWFLTAGEKKMLQLGAVQETKNVLEIIFTADKAEQ